MSTNNVESTIVHLDIRLSLLTTAKLKELRDLINKEFLNRKLEYQRIRGL